MSVVTPIKAVFFRFWLGVVSFWNNLQIGVGRLIRNKLLYVTLVVLVLFLVLGAIAFRISNFTLLGRLVRKVGIHDIKPLINGHFYCYMVQYVAFLFLVPLFVSAFSATQIANEAGSGTLRQVLPRQRSRVMFFLAKVVLTFGFTVIVYLGFMALAYGIGRQFFGGGDLLVMPDLRENYYRPFTMDAAQVMWRLGLSTLLGAASMLVLASLGLMISTLTNSAVHAVVTTVAIYFLGYAASSIPFLVNLTQWLFTSSTDVWLDVYVNHIDWSVIICKLAFCGANIMTFLSVAVINFLHKDIHS